MGITNPDILIPKLNDLLEHISRWEESSNESLREANETQKIANDKVEQGIYEANIMLNQAEQDFLTVSTFKAEAEEFHARYQEYLSQVIQLEQATQSQKLRAEQTLSYWNLELQKALAWLEQAKFELQQAIIAVNQAEQDVYHAESQLRNAEASLRNCQQTVYRDKDGRESRPDCSGHMRAVSSAQQRLSQARLQLQMAQERKHRAEIEVARAQARVNCCNNAVAFSEQAVQAAYTALQYAVQAVNYAERTLEQTQVALQHSNLAEEKANLEEVIAQEAFSASQDSIRNNEQSQLNLKKAEIHCDAANNLAVTGRQELDVRLGYLREFAAIPDQLTDTVGNTKKQAINSFATTGQITNNTQNALEEILNVDKRMQEYKYLLYGDDGIDVIAEERWGKDYLRYKAWGHSIVNHVCHIKNSELKARVLGEHPKFMISDKALKFLSEKIQVDSICAAYEHYKEEIENFFAKGEDIGSWDLPFENTIIGEGYINIGGEEKEKRIAKEVIANIVRVVFIKDIHHPRGYRLFTAYPWHDK